MTTPDPYPLHEAIATALQVSNAGTGALVQSAWNGQAVGNGTVTVTLGTSNPSGPSPGATTAGNCLIVYAGSDQGTTNPVVSGVTLGSSALRWVAARQQNNNADLNCECWVGWNIAGGQTAVAVTFAGGTGAGGAAIVRVEERSGIVNTASPVDQVNGANGSSAAPASGNTPTLSQSSELVVGAICGGNILTGPASPWVNEPNVAQAPLNLITGAQAVTVTTGIGYSGTMTSAVWGAVVVSLKLTPQTGTPAGNGTVRITPGQPGAPGSGVGAGRNSGLMWNVSGVAVSVATNTAEASCSVYVSYGIQSATPGDLQGQTQTGSTGDTCTMNAILRPGDWITVAWSGGDPGSIATARIFGTVTPPGVK